MRSPAPRFLRPWVLRPIRSRAARSFVPALLALALAAGCATQGLRPAVSMKVERHEDTPKSALVYIDEQYIGTLGYVAARGVRRDHSHSPSAVTIHAQPVGPGWMLATRRAVRQPRTDSSLLDSERH